MPPPSPGDKRRWVSAEALKTRSEPAGATLVVSPGAVTNLAAWQGLDMAAFILALVEGHKLTSDDCENAFPFSAFMLFEAQH
jgi:hypothetical protein